MIPSYPRNEIPARRSRRTTIAGASALLLAGGLLAGSTGVVPAWSSPRAEASAHHAPAVSPAASVHGYGLWSSRHPAGSAVQHAGAVTVGTRFHTNLRGRVYGVRFYRTSQDLQAHTATLWGPGGRALRTAQLAAEAKAGWQTAYFTHPVTIRSAADYVVGYRSDSGRYFQGARTLSRTQPSPSQALVATGGLLARGAGVPRHSAPGGRNTYVDVAFARIPKAQLAKGFPNRRTTGVPAGTTLSTYKGPMTVHRDGTVIDGKTIDGDLLIEASNVLVENSMITGDVRIDSGDSGNSFIVKRSTIDAGRALGEDAYDGTGISSRNFKAIRVNVYGGKRGINCDHYCVVRSSWVHGQAADSTGVAHESAVRMGDHARIVDNRLICNAPEIGDAGCSADLTGYGDFSPVQHNLILHNLFEATTSGGTCAYGGSSAGKPYSNDAEYVQFVDNVFKRGHNRSDHGTYICGYYATVMDFDRHATGNVFTGNVYDDGHVVHPG